MNSTRTVSPSGREAIRPVGPEHADHSDQNVVIDSDEAAGDVLSTDELFHLLQNSRRRAVLRYLRGREEPVRMRDVAEQVAAWEHDTTVEQLSSDERQRVYIALYQSHLGTLAGADVIDYDKSRGVIEPRPVLDYVASFIDAVRPPHRRTDGDVDTDAVEATPGVRVGDGDTNDVGDDRANDTTVDEWDRRYLGASVIGALLVVGTVFDATVFQAIPVSGVVVAVIVLLLFSMLTAAKLRLGGDGRGRDERA